MPKKAQGALEYVVIIGAVLFFIVLVVVVTKTNVLGGGSETAQTKMQQWNTAINAACDIGIPCPTGYDCAANGSCIIPTPTPAPTPMPLSCPYTISSPGSYELTTDLNCVGSDGVTIATSNVTINCNGHTLTGDDYDCMMGYAGIRTPWGGPYSDITIRNCSITNFCYGMQLQSISNGEVSSNTIYLNSPWGTGISSTSTGVVFYANNVSGSQNGFYFDWSSGSNLLVNNIACNNGGGGWYNDFYLLTSQAANINSTCDPTGCYQNDVWGLCVPDFAWGSNCDHLCGPSYPPTVTLIDPSAYATVPTGDVYFNYTPTDDLGFNSATLYVRNMFNSYSAPNASELLNDSLNTIVYNMPNAGEYSWLVEVCDNDSQCRNSTEQYFSACPSSSEPTNISYCGYQIGCSGAYRVNTSLSCSGVDAIDVYASDVDLDCQGYSITGDYPGGLTSGIYADPYDNITVRNCNVTNFYAGITLSASDSIVFNNSVSNCDAGIYSGGSNNNVSHNNATDNGQYGFRSGSGGMCMCWCCPFICFCPPSNSMFDNNLACNNNGGTDDFHFTSQALFNTNSVCDASACYQQSAWGLCTPDNPGYNDCNFTCPASPCNEINQSLVPYTINASGRYCLTEDVVLPVGNVITITSSDVELDCFNHVLSGAGPVCGAMQVGVVVGTALPALSDVTVKNCNLHDFCGGIYFNKAEDGNVSNNHVYNNYYGMVVAGNSTTFSSNNATSNLFQGFTMLSQGSLNTFSNNLACDNNCTGGVCSDFVFNKVQLSNDNSVCDVNGCYQDAGLPLMCSAPGPGNSNCNDAC